MGPINRFIQHDRRDDSNKRKKKRDQETQGTSEIKIRHS